MALIFCNDDGSNTSPYETWAKAATTFLVAVDFASAGDEIRVAADHSELAIGTVTFAFPGTSLEPNRVISVTFDTTTYNPFDNIQMATGGTGDMNITGDVQFYGISLEAGDEFRLNDANSRKYFEDCEIRLTRGASGKLEVGNSSGLALIELVNTDITWTGTNHGGIESTGSGIIRFIWRGGTLNVASTPTATLFQGNSRAKSIFLSGVDLSVLTGALVQVDINSAGVIEFHHCLINSSVALTIGTIDRPGTEVLMSGVDDTTGNDLYRMDYIDFWGSTVHDDVIFRDDGAKDPDGNNISWKMVSTANAVEFSEPTKSPPIPGKWLKTTGAKTFTVHIDYDSAIELNDDDIWIEIEYLSASADTESDLALDDRMADILATPAVKATSTEAWTGTGGFSNEKKRKLVATATVNRVGPIIARVCLAKPSVTVYIDPKIEVT